MRDGWKATTLGEICNLTKGTTPTLKAVPGRYPLVVTAAEFLTSDNYQFEGEAVCVPMVSSTGHGHASLKRVHYVRGQFAVANIITALQRKADAPIDMKFLWLLLDHGKDEIIVPLMKGTANVSLSQKALSSAAINLPPLSDQRRIVDLIGAADGAIEAAQVSSASLEPTWWAMTRALEESVEGRDTKLLGTISEIHGGLTKNKKDADRSDAVEVPYLRVANVHRRRLDLSEVTTIVASRSRVEAAQLLPGDLLMNEGGDRDKLGRGAIWRGEVPGCTHQNHVFRVRITDPEFVPEFVSAWANSFGQKWFEVNGSQTTGIASISKTTLSRFPVPNIASEEQAKWAGLLDSMTEHQWQAEAFVDRLRTLRTNLLTALLSGEHEIPESYDELMETAS